MRTGNAGFLVSEGCSHNVWLSFFSHLTIAVAFIVATRQGKSQLLDPPSPGRGILRPLQHEERSRERERTRGSNL